MLRIATLILLALLAPPALAQTWSPQVSGTSTELNGVHFIRAMTGFAVGEGGAIVKFPGSTTATEPGAAPQGIGLSAPSPNPSVAAAHLTVEVAEAQRVTVTVQDALGRRVAVLHDGAMAAGTHALVVEGALPAGTYVVRVEVEGGVLAR